MTNSKLALPISSINGSDPGVLIDDLCRVKDALLPIRAKLATATPHARDYPDPERHATAMEWHKAQSDALELLISSFHYRSIAFDARLSR